MDDPSTTEIDGASYLVTATYEVKNVEEALPESFGQVVTSEEGSKLVIDSSDSKFVGDVQIKLNFAMQDYLDGSHLSTQVMVKVTPMPPPEMFILGAKPGFDMTGIETFQEIAVGDGWQFNLPPTKHESTEPIEVKYETVDFKSSSSFVNYDEKDGVLSIEENFTELINMGQHQIKLQLVDANGKHSEWLEIMLKIIAPKEEAQEDSSDDTESGLTFIDEEVGQKYASFLSERLSRAEATVASGPKPPPPRAEISQISSLGLVQITFTNEMMELPAEIKLTPDGITLDVTTNPGRVLSTEVISADGFRVRVLPAEGS